MAPYSGTLAPSAMLCVHFECSGPFCGTILGYFGAEVVKVEPLAGDPLRTWRLKDNNGTSLWYVAVILQDLAQIVTGY